jgi:hypothetical protein
MTSEERTASEIYYSLKNSPCLREIRAFDPKLQKLRKSYVVTDSEKERLLSLAILAEEEAKRADEFIKGLGDKNLSLAIQGAKKQVLKVYIMRDLSSLRSARSPTRS